MITILRRGSRGRLVELAQTRLVAHGFHVAVDGVYGDATRDAVIQFQTRVGVRPPAGVVGPRTWRHLFSKPKPIPAPSPPGRPGVFVKQRGIDCATWPDYRKLRAEGYTFVCRYLSHNPEKNLTKNEANAAAANKVSRVVVWETTADRAKAGRAAGADDAHNAAAQARDCGMPPHRPIYFAVDFNTNGHPDVVDEYFKGVASVLGVNLTGAYGGLEVITHLFRLDLIRFGWQTYAWSSGQWERRAQLRQVENGITAGGVRADRDESAHTDFGQW